MLAGLRFAGTRDGNAQELLYKYAVYFLNEVCLEMTWLHFIWINCKKFTTVPADKACLCFQRKWFAQRTIHLC